MIIRHVFHHENGVSLKQTSQAPLGRGSATCRSQEKSGSSSGIAAWAVPLFSIAFLSFLNLGSNVVLVFSQRLFFGILWILNFHFHILVFTIFWILRILFYFLSFAICRSFGIYPRRNLAFTFILVPFYPIAFCLTIGVNPLVRGTLTSLPFLPAVRRLPARRPAGTSGRFPAQLAPAVPLAVGRLPSRSHVADGRLPSRSYAVAFDRGDFIIGTSFLLRIRVGKPVRDG